MKKRNKIIFGTAGAISLITPLAVVACGTTTGTSQANERVKLSFEEPWRPVILKGLNSLSAEDRALVDLVPIPNEGSLQYLLETVILRPTDAADLFVAPADRYSQLVESNIVQDLGTIPTFTTNFGVVNGKNYSYTLNVESVIQIFNKNLIGNETGWLNYEDAIATNINDQKNFLTQYSDMWHASSVLLSTFKDAGATLSPAEYVDGSSAFIKQEGTTVTAPFLDQTNIATQIKSTVTKLWEYNNNLRKSTNTSYQNFANKAQGSDRNTIIRQGLASGDVASTIEGPWMINDLVGRILLANQTNKAAAVTMLQNIKTAILPKVANKNASHFLSGWSYSLNRAGLAKLGATNTAAIQKKLDLSKRILAAITSKDLATDWFLNTGRISATEGANVNLSADIINSIQLTDPTNPNGSKLNLSDWVSTTGFADSLSALYTSVISSVSDQSKNNVPLPTIAKFGRYWQFWDELGLSAATFSTADAFYNVFKQNINRSNNE
ncbi:maltose-binding protein [[Mycoplasma] mobile]|uniref:maltose-binding protein n=1 Tax=[Mycoplasma] mobile TaxID=2118 RepID=UPI00003755F1|nr:maltose-binding protein [[Mycoplasma] mobile]AAT27878.1 truncated maltose-binding protein [Mycoplasma mobile 163K]